jgi:hypothetical protein
MWSFLVSLLMKGSLFASTQVIDLCDNPRFREEASRYIATFDPYQMGYYADATLASFNRIILDEITSLVTAALPLLVAESQTEKLSPINEGDDDDDHSTDEEISSVVDHDETALNAMDEGDDDDDDDDEDDEQQGGEDAPFDPRSKKRLREHHEDDEKWSGDEFDEFVMGSL